MRPATQARNAIVTIAKALEDAGSSLKDVVRVRYYLTDMADYDALVESAGAGIRRHPSGRDHAGLRADHARDEDRDRSDRPDRRARELAPSTRDPPRSLVRLGGLTGRARHPAPPPPSSDRHPGPARRACRQRRSSPPCCGRSAGCFRRSPCRPPLSSRTVSSSPCRRLASQTQPTKACDCASGAAGASGGDQRGVVDRSAGKANVEDAAVPAGDRDVRRPERRSRARSPRAMSRPVKGSMFTPSLRTER